MLKTLLLLAFLVPPTLVRTPARGGTATPSAIDSGPTTTTGVDELVFGRLSAQGIQPATLCSDAVFVRRVYLDVMGTLPTALEARTFILDRDPQKRRVLIERLLARDEFADYWAMKWSDVLRIKAEFPINLWPNAAQAYHHWIRAALKQNMPYDRFARELLTASGSNFEVPQVNFYRALQSREPGAIARTVALTFMGARADRWPSARLSGMATFFSQVGYKATREWKEEIVFWDPVTLSPIGGEGRGEGEFRALLPDGTRAQLAGDRDPREVFADWLIDPKNEWFTRNIVNRTWSWLLGRGIIHEPDDIRPDNPPSQPELLAFLEHELVASHYDLKHVYRLILNSKTYQLSCVPATAGPEAASRFAFYPLRRLDAEVLIDAINQVTGSSEHYSSPIPEPFTVIPADQRSIALPDGSITSSFLELFGRPPRDTGLESERNNRVTAAQRLQLLNSSHIQGKIAGSRMIESLLQSNRSPREIAIALYLDILSRFPGEDELKTTDAFLAATTNRRQAVIDLAWALINSAEFVYRH